MIKNAISLLSLGMIGAAGLGAMDSDVSNVKTGKATLPERGRSNPTKKAKRKAQRAARKKNRHA